MFIAVRRMSVCAVGRAVSGDVCLGDPPPLTLSSLQTPTVLIVRDDCAEAHAKLARIFTVCRRMNKLEVVRILKPKSISGLGYHTPSIFPHFSCLRPLYYFFKSPAASAFSSANRPIFSDASFSFIQSAPSIFNVPLTLTRLPSLKKMNDGMAAMP